MIPPKDNTTIFLFNEDVIALPFKKRFREAMIEEFNQRSHEKCGYQSAHAWQKAGQRSDRDTEQVTGNPDELERETPLSGNDDRYCVIDRYTQIRSHIER